MRLAGRVLLHIVAILCAPAVVAAQRTEPDAAPTPAVAAHRLAPTEAIVVDGILDESAWRNASPATGFRQREPNTGTPATEPTTVRVLYDAGRLLLGVTLEDGAPDAILANQMARDGSFEADDRFAWVLDTFRDGRTGYYFEVNPNGAMGDGLIGGGDGGGGGGNDDINRSWDGIWNARVRRSDTGWTAEIEIPFRTVSFDPALNGWGINFLRVVRRKNEESLWTGHALNQGLTRLINAGQLTGVTNVTQGIGLDLRPYIVGHLSSAPGLERSAHTGDGDVGLDAFYNLTPALGLNVSVNTDFAETEVDERRVNLTRFPLFFEEKRAFFLEGSGYFDFGRMPGRTVVPFFSREIGRDVRGQPQRIDVGLKLTGRAGAFDVGLLQVRTGDSEEAAQVGESFSVARVRRRLFDQSYVGGLYTRRADGPSGERHTAGFDFSLATSQFRGGKNLDFSGFYLHTSGGAEAPRGSAGFGAALSYPNDPWTASIAASELQPGYDPAIGFVERRGFRQYSPSIEWAPRLDTHRWIRGLEFAVDGTILHDLANEPLTREFEFTLLQVNTHDGGRYQFRATRHFERLEEDFEISEGVVLPAQARYGFTRYELEAQTAESRPISVAPSFIWGDFFSGRRRQLTVRVDARPRAGLTLALELERNRLDLAEGAFTTDVFRLNANTQFSPWVSLANNVQYDTVSGLLGWQMRLRWIQRPGNDLYVVYTHNWRNILDVGDRRGLSWFDNRLATKIGYTLRF